MLGDFNTKEKFLFNFLLYWMIVLMGSWDDVAKWLLVQIWEFNKGTFMRLLKKKTNKIFKVKPALFTFNLQYGAPIYGETDGLL